MARIDPSRLYNGIRVHVQLSRRDNQEGTTPEWREPQIVTLFVYRRIQTGKIITLTTLDFDWAEYSEDDYSAEFDEWLCDEYRMKILEVI